MRRAFGSLGIVTSATHAGSGSQQTASLVYRQRPLLPPFARVAIRLEHPSTTALKPLTGRGNCSWFRLRCGVGALGIAELLGC